MIIPSRLSVNATGIRLPLHVGADAKLTLKPGCHCPNLTLETLQLQELRQLEGSVEPASGSIRHWPQQEGGGWTVVEVEMNSHVGRGVLGHVVPPMTLLNTTSGYRPGY